MRQLLPFLACLMLILISWSGMAHAGEATGGDTAGYDFSYHAPGDGDEVPGDGDSSLPHHHSACHSHDLGTPAMGVPQFGTGAASQILGSITASSLSPTKNGVTPRPPRA